LTHVISFFPDIAAGTVPKGSHTTLHGKFVQVLTQNIYYFIAGPLAEFPYHANLVDRFCTQREIPCGWVRRPDLVEIFDVQTTIRGGGLIMIDLVNRLIRLSGKSTAYGRYNADELSVLIENHDFFNGFKIDNM